jgi:hypothetical protein
VGQVPDREGVRQRARPPPTKYRKTNPMRARYKRPLEGARREQVRTMASALLTFRPGHSRREKLSSCSLLPFQAARGGARR